MLSLKSSDNIQIIYKNRGAAEKVFVEDFNILFKTTQETPVTKGNDKPTLKGTEKILYRYKQRASFINENARLDITLAKESNNLSALINRFATYEIEMEVTNKKLNSDTLFADVEAILKIVQDSDTIISKTEAKEVLQAYQSLLNLKTGVTHLDSRNVVSI